MLSFLVFGVLVGMMLEGALEVFLEMTFRDHLIFHFYENECKFAEQLGGIQCFATVFDMNM